MQTRQTELTLTEAARYLGVSGKKLHRLVAGGEIPAHPCTLSRRQYLLVADLDALLARSLPRKGRESRHGQ